MSTSDVAIILPARYQSSRFPGKPLADIGGRPLIEWVYRRASEVRGVARVVVATDHDGIADAVRGFGGEVVMTSAKHSTGTDRVAEAARDMAHEIVINLQGDEPVFPPALVEDMINVLETSAETDVVTACHPIGNEEELQNPNIVKVVMDESGRALYFSRAAMPYRFGARGGEDGLGFRHIGIYGFRRAALLDFAAAEPTPLERTEGLEQLRALENGMTITVVKTDYSTVGVDVPDDIKHVEKALTSA